MGKFDAIELATDEVHRMTLINPTTRQPIRDKDGKEAYVEHYSSDSEVARKVNREISRRRLKAGRAKITPEEIEADGLELLAAITTGWYLVDFAGNPIDVPFTQENARELYASRKTYWLREQVDDSAVDRVNFSKGSSTS